MFTPDFNRLRLNMVRDQLAARGLGDERILEAFRQVPRHAFVPRNMRRHAYEDKPLPIGNDQTISQPYIVAYMLWCARLNGDETVLEIGTGSGYQTALLSHLVRTVYSIERHEALAQSAVHVLNGLGYANVKVFAMDGTNGLPQHAPYHAIIVSAVAPFVPEPLTTQLADGGRLVLPVGEGDHQRIVRITRTGDTFAHEDLIPVRFVPLIGQHGFADPKLDPKDPGAEQRSNTHPNT
jgi:protein-L-isoaspartate(D-aspartate) O-methyltransferase